MRQNHTTEQLSRLLRELAMLDSYCRQCDMELEQHVERRDVIGEVDVLMRAATKDEGQP